MEVAYSGDKWIGGDSERSTLTITAPSGAMVEESLSGTGLYDFLPMEFGAYTVALATDSTNMVGIVTVMTDGFTIKIR